MDDFLKKHNFNPDSSNRKNRKFNIVRYFPKIQTYEFINVGIILYDEHSIHYKLLQEDEVSKLHCPSLINAKVLKNSLISLDNFLQAKTDIDSTIGYISNRYKNILETSFQLVYSGKQDSKDMVEKLFYDYIGYKFDIEKKENPILKIINKTENIVEQEFKNVLKVKKSKINGYSLDFLNTKTNQIHHSLLGSIENSENVARAFLNAPVTPKNGEYNFLNTKQNFSDPGVSNRIKLDRLNIKVYPYYSEDDIEAYCKNIL